MTEGLPMLDTDRLDEPVHELALVEEETGSVLNPRNWLIMKETDLPIIERQIVEGMQLLAEGSNDPFFFLNNFPDMLPGGRRRVGRLRELLDGDHATLGHAAVRLGDPEAWTEEEKLLRSDHIKGMTNGDFYKALDEAVQLVGAQGAVEGLSAKDFEDLNGLRTLGKLAGDDLRKHYAFELEVYKRLRQERFGFSHDDLWH